MATARRDRFVHATLAWLLGSVLLLTSLGSFSLEMFFVLSLTGFLIVTEVTAPFSVTPAWRSRLRWFVAAGLLAFAYLVARRVLSLLPPEVL